MTDELTDDLIPACKAFPRGIPLAIWQGRNNHTQPYPGDNGVRYQAAARQARP